MKFTFMNLNHRFRRFKKILLIVAVLGLIASITFLIWKKSVKPSEHGKKLLQSENLSEELRELRYTEVSPDKLKNIISYKLTFNKGLFKDYYNYLESQNIIALEDIKTRNEQYLFVGEERTGDPHWLNNNYVFFTAKCGTDCQGLYLLDTRDKESRLGVLSYLFEKGFWETVFQDWFDQKFRFPELVQAIKSKILSDKSYLIFQLIDDKKNSLGEKRFLFTGKALVEQ